MQISSVQADIGQHATTCNLLSCFEVTPGRSTPSEPCCYVHSVYHVRHAPVHASSRARNSSCLPGAAMPQTEVRLPAVYGVPLGRSPGRLPQRLHLPASAHLQAGTMLSHACTQAVD